MRDGVPANRAGATLKPYDLALKAIVTCSPDSEFCSSLTLTACPNPRLNPAFHPERPRYLLGQTGTRNQARRLPLDRSARRQACPPVYQERPRLERSVPVDIRGSATESEQLVRDKLTMCGRRLSSICIHVLACKNCLTYARRDGASMRTIMCAEPGCLAPQKCTWSRKRDGSATLTSPASTFCEDSGNGSLRMRERLPKRRAVKLGSISDSLTSSAQRQRWSRHGANRVVAQDVAHAAAALLAEGDLLRVGGHGFARAF